MLAVEVKNVSKTYGSRKVVNDVAFSVSEGEILGLIGPNGAGKTTNIRMIMDIIKPDSGEVLIFGKKFSEDSKKIIGYLPEERGLYRKTRVLDAMVYLATLKGMDAGPAKARAGELLARVNMQAHQFKKIEELSHGMAQLVQILATVIHDPQVLIFDEPFSGLDPVNVKLVKDMIISLKNQGKAIMLSTHRMNEVEELCDRIFMINHGQNVLYGRITDIKARYRNNSIIVEFDDKLGEIKGVSSRVVNNHTTELFLDGSLTHQQVLEQLVSHKTTINRFEVSTPSLNEIFIQVAGKDR